MIGASDVVPLHHEELLGDSLVLSTVLRSLAVVTALLCRVVLRLGFLLELAVEEPLIDLDARQTRLGHSFLAHLAIPLSAQALVERVEVVHLLWRFLATLGVRLLHDDLGSDALGVARGLRFHFLGRLHRDLLGRNGGRECKTLFVLLEHCFHGVGVVLSELVAVGIGGLAREDALVRVDEVSGVFRVFEDVLKGLVLLQEEGLRLEGKELARELCCVEAWLSAPSRVGNGESAVIALVREASLPLHVEEVECVVLDIHGFLLFGLRFALAVG